MTASNTLRPPRWAVVAAHSTLLVTLPSGLWRVLAGVGFDLGFAEEFWGPHVPGWGSVYLISLSVAAEGLAFLTLGLVRPWGEQVPNWIPLLGGRTVRPWAAIVPATIGGLALVALWTPMTLAFLFGGDPAPDEARGLWAGLMAACYLPLVAWGPLLLAVTFAYHRRRCQQAPLPQELAQSRATTSGDPQVHASTLRAATADSGRAPDVGR